MEMKDVYEKLEQMEGGAELIAAIKSEVSKLNGEAKTNRESGAKEVLIKSPSEFLISSLA